MRRPDAATRGRECIAGLGGAPALMVLTAMGLTFVQGARSRRLPAIPVGYVRHDAEELSSSTDSEAREVMMRRIAVSLGVTVTVVLLLLAGLTGSALAQGNSGAPAQPTQNDLHVTINVKHFYATSAGAGASGTATATLTPIGQHPITVNKPVRLAVSRSGSCSILSLTLEKLELSLLGLNVNLDKVVLNVTGQPRGGVLGSLFCSLARAKVKAARVAAASRLNTAIRRNGAVRPLAFGVPIRATTAATGPTCPVLNLVLGPLHLNLLGLVVDLNQVHLTITADPAGGVLGSLFCGLANTKLP